MAELKTKKNDRSVQVFLNAVEDPKQRKDCKRLSKLMREVTGARPSMWGDSIVGFGSYHYKYASGREGDWPVAGFSPRKNSLSLYLTCDLSTVQSILKRLGTHKTGVGCLYIKRLSDVNEDVLRELIETTSATVAKHSQVAAKTTRRRP